MAILIWVNLFYLQYYIFENYPFLFFKSNEIFNFFIIFILNLHYNLTILKYE